MKILGEVTIALDKASYGIYDSNVTCSAFSFTETNLKKCINSMVTKSSQNIGELVVFMGYSEKWQNVERFCEKHY